MREKKRSEEQEKQIKRETKGERERMRGFI